MFQLDCGCAWLNKVQVATCPIHRQVREMPIVLGKRNNFGQFVMLVEERYSPLQTTKE